MKNLFRIISLLILTILVTSPSFAQSRKNKRQQAKYLSSYEKETLANNNLPITMPYNRWIDPAGEQIYFGDSGLENHAFDCAVSPDGKWVAVEGRYSIVILSTKSKKIISRTTLKSFFGRENVSNTFSGISWQISNNKQELFWSAAGAGKSFVIKAEWDNSKAKIVKIFEFNAVAPAKTALPNEVLLTQESGSTMLYVVLNGNNTLEKLDETTGETIWSVPTGVAPYGIAKANGKLYVTNWAGGIPGENDKNVAGVPWGSAKVDPETGAVREGTVSIFEPKSGKFIKEITIGLHPNDIVSGPDEKFIYVANANSDAVSVINTKTDAISETISVRLGNEKNQYWGDSPNGLGILGDGKTLFVANGMDNAVAVVELGNLSSATSSEKQSRTIGFIPTGAYPGAVCIYNDSLLFVPNIEAEGARTPNISESTGTVSYNSHRMMASVSIIPVPDKNQLSRYTKRVKETNQFFRIALSEKLPRKNAVPVPVPARLGEPSVFKHVVYIIKENRTYDQILGDVKKGDGDPSLCVFGKEVTPNTHKITDDFLLLDNYYVSGKCSAEGHQWTDMAIVTDYIEKSVRAWFRSYPHVQKDALVYSPTGFIWDNARHHGKSVRIYGEACEPEFADKNVTWGSIYKAFKKGETLKFTNHTTIDPVRNILSPNFPASDSHLVPDVLRAKAFIDEMKEYESRPGDEWPELIIMALSNDHTAGTRPGLPTPRAMVADNDLALGQILEAISNSRFWKNTAVFITEDDSQAGWDHVSAYRTVGLIASPYSKLNKTVRTNYNQISLIRTIEQILGLPPMNIMDATAMPMFDCFSDVPNYKPFNSVLNETPLDEMNKDLSQLKGTALHFAKKSMEPQFDKIDAGDDALFNRILWNATNKNKPYPVKYSGKDDDDD
ncbi:MAG: hypothetical protein L3J11_05425 [Draconibacterium sp.]|nr:hypothetical protein [Draconibacterium sp.]